MQEPHFQSLLVSWTTEVSNIEPEHGIEFGTILKKHLIPYHRRETSIRVQMNDKKTIKSSSLRIILAWGVDLTIEIAPTQILYTSFCPHRSTKRHIKLSHVHHGYQILQESQRAKCQTHTFTSRFSSYMV